MHDTPTPGADAPADTPVDTAATQPSTADVGKTDTPEATQDQTATQEAATPDTKAEDTVEEKLYAGKYKTVEEMEEAYRNLNAKATKDAMERAELTRILDSNLAPTPPPVEDTGFEEPERSSVEDQLLRDNAVMKFVYTHQDAPELSDAMGEILAKDPVAQSIPGHEAKLEYAYQKARNLNLDKTVADARKDAVQQNQQVTAQKQAAQVEEARQSAPVNEKSEKVNRMRAGDRGARSELIADLPAVQEMKRQAGWE